MWLLILETIRGNMAHLCMSLTQFLPLPLDVLRPLDAPAIGPPPRPVSRSTAALFTDMEKFLCKHKQWEGKKRSALRSIF